MLLLVSPAVALGTMAALRTFAMSTCWPRPLAADFSCNQGPNQTSVHRLGNHGSPMNGMVAELPSRITEPVEGNQRQLTDRDVISMLRKHFGTCFALGTLGFASILKP